MIKKNLSGWWILLVIFTLSSCKSEFEKLRVSGDPELLYKKAFEYYDAKDYQKAQTLFELTLGSVRGKVESEKVYFYYAYSQYHLGKYILASYYFKDFSAKFLNSEYREEADFMTHYANYKLSPVYRLDQSYTEKAIDGMQIFVNTYPNSERVSECNRLIDEMRAKLEDKAYAQGKLYFDLKQYQAAIQSFENLLKDYPDTKNDELIRYNMVKAAYLFAQNSIITKQVERYTSTQKYCDLFLSRYPKSKRKRELKNIYKTSGKKLKSLKNDGYQI